MAATLMSHPFVQGHFSQPWPSSVLAYPPQAPPVVPMLPCQNCSVSSPVQGQTQMLPSSQQDVIQGKDSSGLLEALVQSRYRPLKKNPSA